eukprot:TRINITY_DN7185_c0_g1_i1.p1 TRINITY_DN7185_c0_g1~~TRINITY_DN7185_c0_g1_i1.p1  ORF type:complete len:665 (+),score=191.14 TRINITY_DN7185_c0_g1_i1:1116-3110(+)
MHHRDKMRRRVLRCLASQCRYNRDPRGQKWDFVTKPDTKNRIKMVHDGWDEYDQSGRMLKSVRNGKLVYGKDTPQHDFKQQTLRPASEPERQQPPRPTRNTTDQMKDPWKADSNGIWYSAITQQPINKEKYFVYPGNGKTVEQVLQEMDANNLMNWKPKRNRRTIILIDSKWSGWHEVQWDGTVIKTIREKKAPHPELPSSMTDTPLEAEYEAIKKKMQEENREKQFSEIAREESVSRHQPPKDDMELDGKSLIKLVNKSDNMLVRAYMVFKFMERKNLVATAVTFNSLLTACLNTCQFEMGINVWRMMLSRGILPDVQAYNTLMSLSAKSGKREFVFRVFEEMESFGLNADRFTYHVLLQADSVRAHKIVKRHHSTTPGTVPDGILMRMYCDTEDAVNAFDLWDMLMRSRRSPSVEDYNSMLLLCERRNEYDKAMEIFNNMEERSVSPNFLTYNTVMNMMAINGDVEKLHKVQTMMHDRKVTTLVVLSTFNFAGRETSIVNGVNMNLSVSIDVPTFDGEQDTAMSLITLQMVQYLEHNSDYVVNLKGLPTYTLMHLGREYMQRASLQFHCEKKSLAYLLLKNGATPSHLPPKQLPRINVNARMCMDCHDVFAAASKSFRVKLECNDNNMLHVFEEGEDLSCEEGWRTRDAINVPGSGQYGGGL